MGKAKNTAATLVKRLPTVGGCGCKERKERLVVALKRDDTVIEALKEAFKK